MPGRGHLCGFRVALALHQQRRPVQATRWCERTRACAGPPELYSEEFDVRQHKLEASFRRPSHALHLEPQPASRNGRPVHEPPPSIHEAVTDDHLARADFGWKFDKLNAPPKLAKRWARS